MQQDRSKSKIAQEQKTHRSLQLSISKLKKEIKHQKMENHKMKNYFSNVQIPKKKSKKRTSNKNSSKKKKPNSRKNSSQITHKTKILIKNNPNGELYISSKFRNSPRVSKKIDFSNSPAQKLYQSHGAHRKSRLMNRQKMKNSKFQVNPNISQTILFKNSSIEKKIGGRLKPFQKNLSQVNPKRRKKKVRKNANFTKNYPKEFQVNFRENSLAKKGQISYGFLEQYEVKKKIKTSNENFKVMSKNNINLAPQFFDPSHSTLKITSIAQNKIPKSKRCKIFAYLFSKIIFYTFKNYLFF